MTILKNRKNALSPLLSSPIPSPLWPFIIVSLPWAPSDFPHRWPSPPIPTTLIKRSSLLNVINQQTTNLSWSLSRENHQYRLHLSFNSLFRDPCNHKFFKKLVDDNATLWLEKLHNKNGYFNELTHLYHTGRRTKLLIPSDDQKQGWLSVSSLLSDYKIAPTTYKPDLPATKLSFNP